ncbi:MAG: hypothetical protein M3010_04085 [Candidatus Dormibacteraeota bacterium]|nr:hypothetical protein [Candidatus Dormibacteraeota bacterium]
MKNVGPTTRARAWFLRTFRGRSRAQATWVEEIPEGAGAPEAFVVGTLEVGVKPVGLKAAGTNRPSVVYEVRVSRAGDARSWSSRYGFPPRAASARHAADAALDELDEIWSDRPGWLARVTQGMSEDEVEAMEENPALRLDERSAEWIGPELEGLRERRSTQGTWLEPRSSL